MRGDRQSTTMATCEERFINSDGVSVAAAATIVVVAVAEVVSSLARNEREQTNRHLESLSFNNSVLLRSRFEIFKNPENTRLF